MCQTELLRSRQETVPCRAARQTEYKTGAWYLQPVVLIPYGVDGRLVTSLHRTPRQIPCTSYGTHYISRNRFSAATETESLDYVGCKAPPCN